MSIHVISSDSNDSEVGFHFSDKSSRLPTMKTAAAKLTLSDSSQSDEEEILPLHQRLLKSGRYGISDSSNREAKMPQSFCDHDIQKGYLPDLFSGDEEPLTCVNSKDNMAQNPSSVVVDITSDSEVVSVHSSGSTTPNNKLEVTVIHNISENSNSDSEGTLPDLNFGSTSSSVTSTHCQEFEKACAVPEKITKVKRTQEEKQARKAERCKLREEKAAKAQKELTMKRALQEEKRNMKPGNCIKFVKAYLDLTLLEIPEAETIPTLFKDLNIEYAFVSQPIPYSVTWKRVTSLTYDHFKTDTVAMEEDENQVVVVQRASNFLEAVYQFKQRQAGLGDGETLIDYIRRLKFGYDGKYFTLLVVGTGKYFQQQNRRNQQKYRSNILDTHAQQATQKKTSRKTKRHTIDPFAVSRVDVEEALVDLQIQESCNVRLLESGQDVAEVVASFTKSVAEAPYKQSRDDSEGFSWYAHGDCRNSAKIDKDGNGLRSVWQKQLEQLPLLSVDVAQAIIGEYPSPRALLRAYSQCSSPKEGELLLQGITVRRGIGPLATTRRVGPELSRKIYLLMTSSNGDLVLDTS